jgi:hypothetical protein
MIWIPSLSPREKKLTTSNSAAANATAPSSTIPYRARKIVSVTSTIVSFAPAMMIGREIAQIALDVTFAFIVCPCAAGSARDQPPDLAGQGLPPEAALGRRRPSAAPRGHWGCQMRVKSYE